MVHGVRGVPERWWWFGDEGVVCVDGDGDKLCWFYLGLVG